jgi:hypothetical protein
MITRTVCIDEAGHRYETRTLHKEGWGCSLMNSLRFLAVSFDSFPSLCAEQITGGSNFLEHTWSLLFITGSDRDLARECLLLYFAQTGHQMSELPIDAQSFGAVEFDFFFLHPSLSHWPWSHKTLGGFSKWCHPDFCFIIIFGLCDGRVWNSLRLFPREDPGR